MNVADAHDTAIHMNAEDAFTTAAQLGPAEYQVGFVLTANDPFFFVDVDKCYDSTARWSATALEVLAQFPGAGVEVSYSGKGLHIIGTGKCPSHSCKNAALGLELYTEKRFIALTGTNAIGSAATDCSVALPGVISRSRPVQQACHRVRNGRPNQLPVIPQPKRTNN